MTNSPCPAEPADDARPGLSRRSLISTAAVAATAWLNSCSERTGDTPSFSRTDPSTLLRSSDSLPLSPAGTEAEVRSFLQRNPLPERYRHLQTYLLQGVDSRDLASRVSGGSPLHWDLFGPTHLYVDMHTGWPWSRPGGDWLDAKGVRHGPAAWFSTPVGDWQGAHTPGYYLADVTRLVKLVQTSNRWLALLLTAPTAPRTIAGTVGSPHPPPSIEVVYANGQRVRLRCKVAASLDPSAVLPNTASAQVNLPAVLEFERPAGVITAATLSWTVTAHWSGNNPLINGFLLDPPVNKEAPRQGLAIQARGLDDGLQDLSGVIGVHHYADLSQLSDFVHAEQASITSEQHFDPAIYGTGREDRSKWPHAGQGKWLNAGPKWSLVKSSYRHEGFAPLGPGLGAMRIHMSAEAAADGAVVGYNGTLGANAMICLPEPLFGRLDHIFVRYYIRLGLPGRATARQRLHVQHVPGEADWTSLSGKFGIGPDHSTSFGGVSGTSGGGAGWQMRLAWYECDANLGGPDERGWAPGFHLYDFQANNPIGHRYGTEQSAQHDRWGQRGGAGGVLYAGLWYCIETELKLNTVFPSAPGFLPDGELRTWLDGKLVFEKTGLVFRSLPLITAAYRPNRLRPCRELGVRGLWLNFFHGGKTVNTIDRTLFYSGLVWAKSYIGLMSGINSS